MTALPTSTRVWILSDPPVNEITPNTFSLETKKLPSPLPDKSVLLQTLYFSNDPAQRGWIQRGVSEHRLPIRAGDVMASGGLSRVIASTSSKWQVGDVVSSRPGWAEYVVVGENENVQAIPKDIPSPTLALSLLGLTGLTAWFGLHELGHVSKEHTVVISGAAGSTGSTAIQLAKNVVGCRWVVGIAGGKDKVDYVMSLGADACVDYKSATFDADLAAATPDDCDVYFDNVGGDVLNSMLPRMKRFGRIIACGAISTYNDASKSVLPNYFEVIANRLVLQGFIVVDYLHKAGEAVAGLAAALKAGQLKATGDHETVREVPFEKIPEVWQELFVGGNKGKLITKLV